MKASPSKPTANVPRSWRPRIGITLLGLWMLFTYVPLTRAFNQGPMYSRMASGDWSVRNLDLRGWRGLRWEWASGQPEVTSYVGIHTETAPYPCQRIWIVCRTPGQVTHELGAALVQRLLARPGMVEVALFTHRQLPFSEYRSPDLYVTLDALEEDSQTLPGYLSAHGRIELRVQPSLLPRPVEGPDEPNCVVQASYEARRFGAISAAQRWAPIADALADRIDLEAYLDELQGSDTPPLPSLELHWLHGPIQCAPILALQRYPFDLQSMNTGTAWMVHDDSAWSLDPHGETQRIGDQLVAQLQTEGWSLMRSGSGSATLALGPRRLDIRPMDSLEGQAEFLPEWQARDGRLLGIHHYHPFSAEECAEYLQTCLGEGLQPIQLDSLLHLIDPQQRRELRQLLERLAASDAPAMTTAQQTILEHLRG
ncbi:MAG: hypothetical protein H6830_00820 [Planctomycetes bacterium]|nr:hypothetical protein [Planctomycetota bacterium]MCB9910983.1 hypothetical protein [Planctomycetota bacterium]